MLKDSYRNLNKIDDIENMTILESDSFAGTFFNQRSVSCSNLRTFPRTSTLNELPRQAKFSKDFWLAKPLAEVLKDDDDLDVELSDSYCSRDLLNCDGQHIEFKLYHGREVLV